MQIGILAGPHRIEVMARSEGESALTCYWPAPMCNRLTPPDYQAAVAARPAQMAGDGSGGA
jgi:hypothetical protein